MVKAAMAESKKSSDLIDVESLQKIQDYCSKAMRLAFVTVDYRGRPITKYSGFSKHCLLGRRDKNFSNLCQQCDAHAGLHAAITGQPYIYFCHAGLVDIAVPLIVDNAYVGAVLGGQVRLKEGSTYRLEHVRPENFDWRKNNPELAAAYENSSPVSYEELEASVNLLQYLMQSFMEKQYNHSAVEQLKEANRRLSEELSMQKQLSGHKTRPVNMQSFFFIMNIISRLAYEEKAVKTEAAAYDFADVVRYTMSAAEQRVTTLGEELGHVIAYLRIIKGWVRDQLSYTISVPKEYHPVSCPPMVLLPIIGVILRGLEEGEQERRTLEITSEATDNSLLVHVISNGRTLSPELFRAEIQKPSDHDELTLSTADQKLKALPGDNKGLNVNALNNVPGVDVSFRLPLGQRA